MCDGDTRLAKDLIRDAAASDVFLCAKNRGSFRSNVEQKRLEQGEQLISSQSGLRR